MVNGVEIGRQSGLTRPDLAWLRGQNMRPSRGGKFPVLGVARRLQLRLPKWLAKMNTLFSRSLIGSFK